MGTIPIPIEKNLWNKNEARTKSDPDETLFFIQSIWTISTWRNRWIKSKWQNKSSINFISYIQNKQKRQNRKSIKNRLQIEKSKKRQNTIYKKKKIWYNYFKGNSKSTPLKYKKGSGTLDHKKHMDFNSNWWTRNYHQSRLFRTQNEDIHFKSTNRKKTSKKNRWINRNFLHKWKDFWKILDNFLWWKGNYQESDFTWITIDNESIKNSKREGDRRWNILEVEMMKNWKWN